ncbi:DUF4397 domain-containing protein [Bacillus sp. SJS]|uniref:DUF4397 domain-containing protein n=1 Tax=Bacillus sp. SJS TaxID=1423321 RepID=UPI0004DD89BB|nr:DUF4397 domain-containing protein [Bacillus sp. SJS]KZZ82719.1 peptidase [Bacillus sp. SJS]
MKKLAMMVIIMVFALMGTSVLAAESKNAMVRIVHASPDAPAVDVTVDGNTVVEGAKFKDATDFMALPAGNHKVEIFAAGTVEEGKPVITSDLTVEAGKMYTAAAINTLDNLELKILNDDTMVTDGKSKIRVGHFSPDAPAVDVAVKDGDVLFPGAEFKGVTDYMEVDPGSYDLEVRAAGSKDSVLDLAGTELKENMTYTVLAVGFAKKDPALDAIVLEDPMMPAGMPKTGMGGTSENEHSAAPWAIFAAAAGLGALVIYGKKKSTQ